MYYIGFDLGDGESCLTWFDDTNPIAMPVPIPVTDRISFPTAVAAMAETGETVIGCTAAMNAPTITDLRVCFKRNFRSGDPDVKASYRRFVSGVLAEVKKASLPFDFTDPAVCRFVVGQPADWDRKVLESYKRLLEDCGIAQPLMTSESRAAMLYFSAARSMKFNLDSFRRSSLIADLGSSTLDFAYTVNGATDDVKIFGDPHLGGGLMDEQIVLESIRRIPQEESREKTEKLFREDKGIRGRLMMEARRLKEQYFNDGESTPLSLTIPVFRPEVKSVRLYADSEIMEAVIMYPQPLLDNNSIYEQLKNRFEEAVRLTAACPPEVVILTGGASRMPFVRELCRSAFQKTSPEIAFSTEPELDIARGLALDGSYSAKLEKLQKDLREFAEGSGVENIVSKAMPHLMSSLSVAVIDSLLKDGSEPGAIRKAFREWKTAKGPALSLSDMQAAMSAAVKEYSRSATFDFCMEDTVNQWLESVIGQIQEKLNGICLANDVNTAKVQLKAFRFDEDVSFEGTTIRGGTTLVNTLGTLVTAVTATVTGMLTGGGGIALIWSGIVGIVIGVVLVVFAAFILHDKAEELAMKLPLLRPVRLLIPEESIFNEDLKKELTETVFRKLSSQTALKQDINDRIAHHIDATIYAISAQTKI